MRVCLINPPRIQPKAWGPPCVYQAIDIAYVAAVLEARHEVKIIDAPSEGWRILDSEDEMHYRVGLKNEQIQKRIKQWAPKLVVINVPSSGWWKTASDVASIAKGIDKSAVVAVMGLHPSSRPDDCLASLDIDFAVIREPENTILELADKLDKGAITEPSSILGIAYKNNGQMVTTPPRPLIKDLDALPFPARHLLPMQDYFDAVRTNPLRGEVHKRWTSVTTSRGCVNRCIYCSNHIIMGRGWRRRSPENVVDELEQVVRTYRVKQIDFEDSNMTVDKKRTAAICDLILERGLDFEWFTPTGVRADALDEPLLKKMKKSGCKRIMVAPESGSQRVVTQIIHKNLDLKKIETAIIGARKVGIKVGCFFILGLIGETKQEMNETIQFAYKLKQLGADSFCFNVAQPLYGTELYEQAKQGGFLREDFSDNTLAGATALIETPEFTVDELYHMVARANMVNAPTFNQLVVKGIKNPKRAIRFLVGRAKWQAN